MSSGTRELGRRRRHRRLRKQVVGIPERPRLCVFRSHRHVYAQLIDDMAGRTFLGWSTKDERLATLAGGDTEAAKRLGALIAADIAQQGLAKRVVFDRGGYLYHGRVKALADAARAGGLEF
jgi:large subunit ribosomal protein L18